MNRDIEETRKMQNRMRTVEILAEKLDAVLVGQPAYLAVSALTACLGHTMHETGTPLESITTGLRVIIDMCERQAQIKGEDDGTNKA